ncbi:transcription factor 21 isoform X2 [Alosa sapidissima]|uniref:transcription factor 21 isoform X2 n=1 Tax=Alosa sapidissima TaxID=34773 RepID=UPI001C094A29|nr:transcription factor 21 isoform X2 [Alosa sapidissima]
MSTGSLSDAEDIHELPVLQLNAQSRRPTRDMTSESLIHSRDNSEDEFCIDDSYEGKSKRPKTSAKGLGKNQSDGRQTQRNAANARERARMRVLSKAFSRLKTSLPWVPADTKLSKLDTLRLASSYISHLRQLLQEDRYENSFVHPTWPFVVSGRPEDSKEIATAARLCGATA